MKQTLRAALDERGYTTLTPVQTAVTDPDLDGCDLLVSAQTGSGKTLGFGLAIAPTIMRDADHFDAAGAPLALVIAPTRELALQVMRELAWLFAKAGAVVTSCVGGMDMRDERRALGRGAHIVVATPGRLRDHIMRGSLDTGSLRAVVLDEADEMLDLGFRDDLEFILGETPETRQTLMFSATVPKSIGQLAENYQKDAVRVVAKSEASQHADIEYIAMSVADRDTDNAVVNALRFFEAPNAIVFCNTRAMVGRLTTRLSNRGFAVVALSGELSQTERTHALQAMRDGRARVCVATDVAARGIDLPNLDLVIHAELPTNHETLLHRSGRTGRAGRKGVSALIVTPKVRKKAERILGAAKVRAEWAAAPSAEAVTARDEERLFADPEWHSPPTEAMEATLARLVETFTPTQIATAYLRLYHAGRTAPEEITDASAPVAPRPKQEFGPSVWFSVSIGRTQNAEPRRILPIMCKAGGLTRDDIGAIRIQADASYVQIREPSVAAFLSEIGPDMALEPGITVARLAAPPDLDTGRKPGGKPDRKPAGKPHAPRQYDRTPEAPSPAAEPADWQDVPPSAMPEQPARVERTPEPTETIAPRPQSPKPYAGKPAKPYTGGGGAYKARSDDGGSKGVGKGAGKGPEKGPGAAAGKGPRKAPGEGAKAGPGRSTDTYSGPGKKAYHKPKGPTPPTGKPDSKKNRSRAADSSHSMRKPKR